MSRVRGLLSAQGGVGGIYTSILNKQHVRGLIHSLFTTPHRPSYINTLINAHSKLSPALILHRVDRTHKLINITQM